MARITNWVLINWVLTTIACSAGAALAVDGLHPATLFDQDFKNLLCVAAAIPAVVVAIRRHTERSNKASEARFAAAEAARRKEYAELRAFLADLTREHADRMETIVAAHAQRMESSVDGHAVRMETSVDSHAERTRTRTLEDAMGIMKNMVKGADTSRVTRSHWADTGPFRMPQ
ncbi:hypothetical protein [Microbispora triticiradicis]|uniref:hypothetical protein n=1 Tax=Microbispora triticiradicis TaxID=2200763 RepID=UPI001AD7D5B5|nr:hypothetical protein [Microbispora triticiradicis]MBO4275089.1 hypothetical protein [Microbispora triticiradicis]